MNKLAKLRIQSAITQQCRCFYCGLTMVEPALPDFAPKGLKPKWQKYLRCTAEHLTARQDQGRDNSQNIVAACWWCNTRRHKGREEKAPDPLRYRLRVQSLMKKGGWHPASTLVWISTETSIATVGPTAAFHYDSHHDPASFPRTARSDTMRAFEQTMRNLARSGGDGQD